MNWPKIKTYLIFFLVFANLLIVWLLFTQEGPKAQRYDLQPLMIEKMKKEGITVPSSPSDYSTEIDAVSISNRLLDLAKEKTYYEALGLTASVPETGGAYIYSLASDGKLIIDYYFGEEEDEGDYPTLNPEEALALALSYIPEPKGDLSYELYTKSEEGGAIEFHFEELYKTEPLPDGYIRIRIEKGRLTKLIKSEIEARTVGYIKVIPYDLALYRLYSAISTEDLPIHFTRVDIVRKMEAISTETKLITAETFPYYRFVSDKGSFLVKALAED